VGRGGSATPLFFKAAIAPRCRHICRPSQQGNAFKLRRSGIVPVSRSYGAWLFRGTVAPTLSAAPARCTCRGPVLHPGLIPRHVESPQSHTPQGTPRPVCKSGAPAGWYVLSRLTGKRRAGLSTPVSQPQPKTTQTKKQPLTKKLSCSFKVTTLFAGAYWQAPRERGMSSFAWRVRGVSMVTGRQG